ncbi:PAP2 superfamily-domain-containing protein [Coniella lustricola]|uniref:PAP2 superfamily-domain-containing protein n=1 Tax=Coniella lustricola TaxID=2025994 RepID=A0A2T2ZW54_9PEZI|nr:PAP2 superfamily-domain-containing protein [Coniella lustricola]
MSRIPLRSIARRHGGASSKAGGIAIISSYVFDWVIVLVLLGVAGFLNGHAPNRRPFSLEDPTISFPYTVHETVPSWLLITLSVVVPVVLIPIISLLLVPGHTVPSGTPKSLIWRRKLWELHVGWLGLAVSVGGTWFITNGIKNMAGKPRPDLLARCNPDFENYANFVVGGVDVASGFQRLVSADICRGMANMADAQSILEDGFRSYPSGHSSSSAAGLVYLSLFVASKFAIGFPFLALSSISAPTFKAFPSRDGSRNHYPLSQNDEQQLHPQDQHRRSHSGYTGDAAAQRLFASHNALLTSARQQAAAPPLYLLALTVVPFFTSVFIATSRWFDFRHHGFDILFGFFIGTTCAFFAFRWYHMPIMRGAGWAWGPRSADKAWWAGVGSLSYATDWEADVEGGMRQRMTRDSNIAMEEGVKPETAIETSGNYEAQGEESADGPSRRSF